MCSSFVSGYTPTTVFAGLPLWPCDANDCEVGLVFALLLVYQDCCFVGPGALFGLLSLCMMSGFARLSRRRMLPSDVVSKTRSSFIWNGMNTFVHGTLLSLSAPRVAEYGGFAYGCPLLSYRVFLPVSPLVCGVEMKRGSCYDGGVM